MTADSMDIGTKQQTIALWPPRRLWSQFPAIIQTWKKKVSKACKSGFENSTPCNKGFATLKKEIIT